MTRLYPAADLQHFATRLYRAAGLDDDKARTVARLQVLTDMMGRRTHGLAMAPLYLAALEKGQMARDGQPGVVRDSGATLVWDGRYLPGLWLVNHAIEEAMRRAADVGVVSVAIRRSHHIGCLAALTRQAADRGYVALIANSDPAGRRVAPYGGTEALFTPDPIAFAYPGTPNPVLVDMCASITTTSMTRQKVAEGQLFDKPWLLDAQGRPTRDPAVLEHSEPRGSLQLVGGEDHGHKGFGLALMIEALSQGLAGHGRKDAPTQWGGNVFLQVLDPDFFAGRDAFAEQMDFFGERCRANRPIDPRRPVRLPGDKADSDLRRAEAEGVAYDARTLEALAGAAARLGVAGLEERAAAPA